MFDLIYTLDLLQDAGNIINKFIQYLFILLNSCIYGLINTVYRIYVALASAQLLTTEMFSQISNRLYAIVGVFMLFVLAYAIIQGIVAPDKFISKSGGEGGAIVKRVLIAVIGIALVPGIFRLAYEGQKTILDQNVIGKIFLGFDNDKKIEGGEIKFEDTSIQTKDTTEHEAMSTAGGTSVALNLWMAFFHPTETSNYEEMMKHAAEIKAKEPNKSWNKASSLVPKVACGIAIAAGLITTIITGGASWLAVAAVCGTAVVGTSIASDIAATVSNGEITLEHAYSVAAASGDFSEFLSFAQNVVDGEIAFNPLIMLLVGGVALYLFTTFAIDMAVRAVKLSYMQLIAPIPLLLQIIPKFKDNFNNWLKKTIGLFVEVFIRLTFIYVVIYLIAHLDTILGITVGGQASWLDGADLETGGQLVAKVILIMGFLIFCKTAPGFISETLGIGSGKLDLGIKDKLANGGLIGAGSIIGGLGATTLVNASNAINRGRNAARNGTGGAARRNLRGIRTGLGSFVGGTVNNVLGGIPTYARSAKAAKSFKDIGKGYQDAKKRTQDYEKSRFKYRQEREEELKDRDAGIVTRYVSYPIRNAADTAKKAFMELGDYGKEAKAEGLKLEAEARKISSGLNTAVVNAVDKMDDVQTAQAQLDYWNTDKGLEAAAREIALEKTGDESKFESFMGKEETFRRLAKKKKDATDAVEQARHNAVNKGLFDAMAGIESPEAKKVMSAVRTYVAENAETISKVKNVKVDGNTTVGDRLEAMFGNGIYSGNPSFNGTMMAGDLAANISVKFNNGATLTSDDKGKWTYKPLGGTPEVITDSSRLANIIKNGGAYTVVSRSISATEGTNILGSLGQLVNNGTVQNIRVDGLGGTGEVRVEKSSTGALSYSTLQVDATAIADGTTIKLVPSTGNNAIEAKVGTSDVKLDGGLVLGKGSLVLDATSSKLKLDSTGMKLSGSIDLAPIDLGGTKMLFDTTGIAREAVATTIAATNTISIADVAATFERGAAPAGTTYDFDIGGGTIYHFEKQTDGSVKVIEAATGADVTNDKTRTKNTRAIVDEAKLTNLVNQANAKRVSGLRDSSGNEVGDVYYDGTSWYQEGDTAPVETLDIDLEKIIAAFISTGKEEMEFNNAGHIINLVKSGTAVVVSMDGVEIGVYDIGTGTMAKSSDISVAQEVNASALDTREVYVTQDFLKRLLTENTGISEIIFKDSNVLVVNYKDKKFVFRGREYTISDISSLITAIGSVKVQQYVFIKNRTSPSVISNLSTMVKNAVDRTERGY